jgi:hypothetical protein
MLIFSGKQKVTSYIKLLNTVNHRKQIQKSTLTRCKSVRSDLKSNKKYSVRSDLKLKKKNTPSDQIYNPLEKSPKKRQI